MSSRVEAASGLVVDWLEGEHDYQFGKNSQTHNANPHTSRDYIMETELKNKWHRFQFYRRSNEELQSPKLVLHAGQQVLKATAAARGAVVWDSIIHHHPILRARQSSLSVLQQHLRLVDVAAAELPPPDLLDAPFEEAIYPYSTTPIEWPPGKQYQILPIYINLAGHAINYLLEQAGTTGSMALPSPGVPSGTIEPWKRIFTPHTI